jgi:hypothetical protein
MIYTYNKKRLSYSQVPGTLIAGCFIAVLFVTSTIVYFTGRDQGMKTGIESLSDFEKVMIIKEQDKFTPEKFKEYILELNIKFPHIVYAQAVLETGHFKSQVFMNNQNLFGMKQAQRRASTNSGTELGHAVYKHWRESVVDYALYQCAFLSKLYTEDTYYQYLKENYAESPDYVQNVKKIAEEFKLFINLQNKLN